MTGKETVGAHLLSLHNVHFLLDLMRRAREAILKDEYPDFVRQFFADYYHGKEAPQWAKDALKEVNINL
jgi:queuine tRNA-ribosyltransferase catalytic subunit